MLLMERQQWCPQTARGSPRARKERRRSRIFTPTGAAARCCAPDERLAALAAPLHRLPIAVGREGTRAQDRRSSDRLKDGAPSSGPATTGCVQGPRGYAAERSAFGGSSHLGGALQTEDVRMAMDKVQGVDARRVDQLLEPAGGDAVVVEHAGLELHQSIEQVGAPSRPARVGATRRPQGPALRRENSVGRAARRAAARATRGEALAGGIQLTVASGSDGRRGGCTWSDGPPGSSCCARSGPRPGRRRPPCPCRPRGSMPRLPKSRE